MLVGYARVSTSDGRQSLDLQLDALRAAGVDDRHIYSDSASGAKSDRPGLEACLSFLKPGDTLIVWKLDRLGRSLPHLVEIVAGLKARSVMFRSLTEELNTSSAQGELIFNIFASLAQFERALIRERVNAGLAAAARQGRKGGRPIAIKPETLAMARASLAQGQSVAATARALNINRVTLIGALERIKEAEAAENLPATK